MMISLRNKQALWLLPASTEAEGRWRRLCLCQDPSALIQAVFVKCDSLVIFKSLHWKARGRHRDETLNQRLL